MLCQSAFFRPHDRSEDIANLYLVGANTQPGGGTPAVMMSAKITAREIAKDYGISAAIVNCVGKAEGESLWRQLHQAVMACILSPNDESARKFVS